MDFTTTAWSAQGNMVRTFDERANQHGYYFDGGSWLQTESTFGGLWTASYWLIQYETASWSRHFDFGNGPSNNNILVANKAGSRHLYVRSGKNN